MTTHKYVCMCPAYHPDASLSRLICRFEKRCSASATLEAGAVTVNSDSLSLSVARPQGMRPRATGRRRSPREAWAPRREAEGGTFFINAEQVRPSAEALMSRLSLGDSLSEEPECPLSAKGVPSSALGPIQDLAMGLPGGTALAVTVSVPPEGRGVVCVRATPAGRSPHFAGVVLVVRI